MAEYTAKLANVENEGKRIIEAHVKKAEQQASEVIASAKAQVEALKAKAEVDIDRARRTAQRELLVKTGDIVLQLGSEILGRAITGDDNQKMINEAIERLKMEEAG